MTTPELMGRLDTIGAVVTLCAGGLAIDFEGELPPDLDAELEAHAAGIIAALELRTGPQADSADAAERSPAGHHGRTRDVLTVGVVGLPTGDPARPNRSIENTLADLHRMGVVFLFDGRTLTIDAPRGALDDRRREALADRGGEIAAAVLWLEAADRRNQYRRALALWVAKHPRFLHTLPGFRGSSGRYVNRLEHARALLVWERGEDWPELFRFVDELERFGAAEAGPVQRKGVKL